MLQNLGDLGADRARWIACGEVTPNDLDAERRQPEPFALRRPPRLLRNDLRDALELKLREARREQIDQRPDARISLLSAYSLLSNARGTREHLGDAHHLGPPLGLRRCNGARAL